MSNPSDRRLRYPLLWLGFVACMLVGAGALLSANPRWQAVGLTLIGLPLACGVGLALVYYLVERFRAKV
ncbi:MAG: hypothetical protein ACYDBQ_03015 [Thermoplasmatota archaeon]